MIVKKTVPILSALLILTGMSRTLRARESSGAIAPNGVRLLVIPRSKEWFRRECGLVIDVAITNQTPRPIEVLKFVRLCWASLDFHIEGEKAGRLRRSIKSSPPKPPTAADYNEIPAGGTLKFPVDLVNHMSYRPYKADTYSLKAVLTLKDGRKIRDECSFVIKPIPKLKHQKDIRIARGPKSVRWLLGVDLGFAAVGGHKETLFCVVRESESGKKKLGNLPERTFRLMQTDPKTKIETMVYNPFPQAIDTIVELHVLVNQPNKPQHYFIVDLSSGAELKKKQTLKPGKRYKLHKKKLGPVELVPVDGK